jgi:hypothetical protein
MTNKIRRGRAQLHDLGPADGRYEVDYVIQDCVKNIKNIGFKSTTHRVSSADIYSVNGYNLKNGDYALEQSGELICKLRKKGAHWEMMPEGDMHA